MRKKRRKEKDVKKNELKLDRKFQEEIGSLALIFSGLFFSYSLKAESMGKVGYFIKIMFLGFFSKISIVLPYIMILVGIIHLLKNNKFKNVINYKLYYPVVFFILLIYGLINVDFIPLETPFKPENLKIIFSMSVEGKGSGIFSTIIAFYFTKLFGIKGSYILSTFAMTVMMLFSFDISLKDSLKVVKDFVLKLFNNLKTFAINFVTIEDKSQKTIVIAMPEIEKARDNDEIKIVNFAKDDENAKQLKINEDLGRTELVQEEIKIVTHNASEKFLNYEKPDIELLIRANNASDSKDKKIY